MRGDGKEETDAKAGDEEKGRGKDGWQGMGGDCEGGIRGGRGIQIEDDEGEEEKEKEMEKDIKQKREQDKTRRKYKALENEKRRNNKKHSGKDE